MGQSLTGKQKEEMFQNWSLEKSCMPCKLIMNDIMIGYSPVHPSSPSYNSRSNNIAGAVRVLWHDSTICQIKLRTKLVWSIWKGGKWIRLLLLPVALKNTNVERP